ncbi:hypothetical protein BGZ51_001080 [Haplosporangium sp. Z 767]|nr:hypothetical protein BGZ51_001080 [Haplosporangium sp. Z 767]
MAISASPRSLREKLSRSSLKTTALSNSDPSHTVVITVTESDDQDTTPRPHHRTIGIRSSAETLRAMKSNSSSTSSTPPPTTTATASNISSTSSSSTAVISANSSNTNSKTNSIHDTSNSTPTSTLNKFSRRKQKKLQRQEQEREEQRLKEEANEAMRRKHGQYHPPGHSQGQIHTHRPHKHHDHHQLERSRSTSNIIHQYQHRNPSSVRVASPSPRSRSATSHLSLSSSSSSINSSYKNSYSRGHSRPTSPMREIETLPLDYVHSHPHMIDLAGLDAEGMLSEHWNSNSDEDNEMDYGLKHARTHNDYGDEQGHHRKTSIDTNSSYRTSSSSIVHFADRPLSPSSMTSSQASRKSHAMDTHKYPSISQHLSMEMSEVNKPQHHSWPLNNASMTGIVTGLAPEFDDKHIQRPHSSQRQYPTSTKGYMYHSRAQSPTNSNRPSSPSHHRHYHPADLKRKVSSVMTPSIAEAMRAKAGSRAAGTIRGTTHTGGADTWSIHGTEVSTDEHNYLAPLPPFQKGPAYTSVPKRKFCKWCFGGCRWWVLLLLFVVPAAVIAVIAIFLFYRFRLCVAVDPNAVEPIVYEIDPSSVQGIALEYHTRTKGTINIIDSPNVNETRVLLKLQREFHNMENRQDLTGFHIETLSNGYSRYVLNDDADEHRKFFNPTVLCSNSILTIEMPRTASGRPEIALNALVDQQDVNIQLDETVPRNNSWEFRGISGQTMIVQSLNINALSVSYTSTSPATVILKSVIMREKLSVVSVSGDIQASIGFSSSNPRSLSAVNLNTMDGQVQLDMKAWNQSCTFRVDAPKVQVSMGGVVVLPMGGGAGTVLNQTRLIVNPGHNSISGSFDPHPKPNATATITTSPTAKAITTKMATAVTTTGSAALPTGTTRPKLGAGGSSVPAQLMIHANNNVILNFP